MLEEDPVLQIDVSLSLDEGPMNLKIIRCFEARYWGVAFLVGQLKLNNS